MALSINEWVDSELIILVNLWQIKWKLLLDCFLFFAFEEWRTWKKTRGKVKILYIPNRKMGPVAAEPFCWLSTILYHSLVCAQCSQNSPDSHVYATGEHIWTLGGERKSCKEEPAALGRASLASLRFLQRTLSGHEAGSGKVCPTLSLVHALDLIPSHPWKAPEPQRVGGGGGSGKQV